MQHRVEETPTEQLNRLTHEIEVEKKYAVELDNSQNASPGQSWWTGPIEKMNIQQLAQLKSALEDMKKNVAHQCTNILIQNAMKPNPYSNPALPSRMLQTPMFQNFKLLQSDLGGGLY
ncbi:hypothetical protein TanjilG_12845 [Lupinus angustifolius]|uniref:Agamous-like MADS-box protein AGL62 n=1 Tax=Lupinus angustifolius TaxID=3871 RepID=A0A1J7HQ10_LUPAN|nr:hypothetical protein TanjilG_12845 [Lupinus angustifolius]